MKRLIFLFLSLLLIGCSANKEVMVEQISKKELTENEKIVFGNLFMEGTKEKILGNPEKAVVQYEKALKVDPTSPAAHYELGMVLTQLNRNEEAFNQFEAAYKIDPLNFWYHLSYATLLETGGRIDEAIEQFKYLVENHPNQLELKYELSKLLLSKNRVEEGIKYLNLIEDEIGLTEEISFLKQRIFLSKNNLDAAVKEIKRLIEAYPNELRYYSQLADLYLSNNRNEEALGVYQQMKERDPTNYRINLALAQYYKTNNQEQEYLENITAAFKSSEMNIDEKIKLLLTNYEVDSKNSELTKEAISIAEYIVTAHSNEAKAHALLADFLYFDDQNEAAKQAYFKTIELDSSRLPVWNQLLVILSETNDTKALLNYGERAVNLFPNQPVLYLLYGLGLSADKQYEKSVEYLELGKDLVVDNQALKGQIFASIGDAYHELEQHKASDENYRKALSLDPSNVYVLNNFSYYLSLRKESLDEAKEMSAKSNQIAPGQASFQDTYAWVLYQKEEYEEALVWINKAIDNSKTPSATLLEHKGDILLKLGQEEEAKTWWQKAYKLDTNSKSLKEKLNLQN